MLDAILTELNSNLSFSVKVDKYPSLKKNYTTVYIDDKEVRLPNATELSGLLEVQYDLSSYSANVVKFLAGWNKSKKRIDLMIQTDKNMYFLKGCYIKKHNAEIKSFTIFYNTFKEA